MELFARLKYMEPKEPPRQTFLYNNMMYAAAGYLIELQSGKTWEEFVRERIFQPLDMNASVYSVAEMLKQDDHGVPFTEKRDTTELYENPTGVKFQVVLKEDGSLYLVMPGAPEERLIPYRGLQFHVKEFSDVVWEFVVENEKIKALKQRSPSGEYVFPRK